jgi:ribosomal protein S18 acetylase RimI-like enzyme
MDVRPAMPADLVAVEGLLLHIFSPPPRSTRGGTAPDRRIAARVALRHALGRPVEGVLVAVDDQTLAGVLCVITRESAARPCLRWLPALRPLGLRGMVRTLLRAMRTYYRPAPHEAYLFAFAVAPAYRRHGIAERLLQAAEALARARDKTLAIVMVARGNVASLGLLRKHGYREVPLRCCRGRRFLRLEKPLLPPGTHVVARNERIAESCPRT